MSYVCYNTVMITIVEINDLHVLYDKKAVLSGLTLSVQEGEIFGFLGPNGAGKSTTIKALLGFVFATQGYIKVFGKNPSDVSAKARLGYLPEEATYYKYLKPKEILEFYGQVFGIPHKVRRVRIEHLIDLVGLKKDVHKTLDKFSKGMCQKLGLAQALINDPELLILDEPMTGLDPIARMQLRGILENLKRQGKTIFFSSHELSEVELVCDSMCIIRGGKVMRSGHISEIIADSAKGGLEKLFLDTIKD